MAVDWSTPLFMSVRMKKYKVLVTGGAGVIGRPLVGKLLQQGAEIMVVDLKSRPDEWPKNVHYLRNDLNKIEKDKIVKFNPDLCFHLAASFERTEESPQFFQKNFYNNILLSHALLYALKECTQLKRVVFASSYLVYDSSTYLFKRAPKHKVSLSEKGPVKPRNLCGMAKLLHEQELEFVTAGADFSSVSARIFRVYGKGSQDIISRWIRELVVGRKIKVFSKQGAFDYIYADDVAEGLVKLADSKVEGCVNLGTGESRKVEDILLILKKSYPEMEIEEVYHQGVVEASEADMEKFVKVTGWKPKQTLEKVIPKIISYEKG